MTTDTRPSPSPALTESQRLHALAQTGDPRDYATARDGLIQIAEKRIRFVIAEMVSKNGTWIDRAELESVMLELALRQAQRYLANPNPTVAFQTYARTGLRKRALEAVAKERKHWLARANDQDVSESADWLPQTEASQQGDLGPSERALHVFEASGLGGRAADVLWRRLGLKEPAKTVAVDLGISHRTVESITYRAKSRLRAVTA